MITIPLLASLILGPNFTETVNRSDDKFVLNHTSHDSGNINSPLGVWFSFSGHPSHLSAELNHKGVSYCLFDNYTPTASPIYIAPINDFFGSSISGNWQIKLESEGVFELKQWGITIVPEPSTLSLLFLGTILFYFRKK